MTVTRDHKTQKHSEKYNKVLLLFTTCCWYYQSVRVTRDNIQQHKDKIMPHTIGETRRKEQSRRHLDQRIFYSKFLGLFLLHDKHKTIAVPSTVTTFGKLSALQQLIGWLWSTAQFQTVTE